MLNTDLIKKLAVTLIVCGCTVTSAYSDVVIVDGLNGEPGIPGENGAPGTTGGDGERGADVVAAATGADGDRIARAEARGGNGGDGGRGGAGIDGNAAPGDGGHGGRGGDAFASAINLTVNETPFTDIEAIGGRGGDGGSPGTPGSFDLAGLDGDSGNGGNAHVNAQTVVSNLADSQLALITASARGGGSETVSGDGVQAGHGGDAFGEASMTLENDPTGRGRISLSLSGGAGGWGSNGANAGDGGTVQFGFVFLDAGVNGSADINIGGAGGQGGRAQGTGASNAGDGSSVSLVNSAWGYGEELNVSQDAVGGASGNVRHGDNGMAGTANSEMIFNDNDGFETEQSILGVLNFAEGGRGGNRDSTEGQAASGANATAHSEGASSRRFVTLDSVATGGKGGDGDDGAVGGTAGTASAVSILDHSQSDFYADGFVSTGSTAVGGISGFTLDVSEGLIHRGASATAESQTVSTHSPDTRAFAVAEGGIGSNSRNADGGEGGTSHASAYALGPGHVAATAESTGGAGGGAFGESYVGGNGSATSAEVYGESTNGGTVTVSATHIGGQGGVGSFGAQAGAGANVSLNNAAVGVTAGELHVTQTAVGGEAGTVISSGTATLAGTASTVTELVHNGSSLVITDSATGGNGSYYNGGNGIGSDGGLASVGGSVNSAGDAEWALSAQGGSGGRINHMGTTGSGGGAELSGAELLAEGDAFLTIELRGGAAGFGSAANQGGDGGAVIVNGPVYAASTNGGQTRVELEVTGGSGLRNGSADDVVLVNLIDGDTTGQLEFNQIAIAGDVQLWDDTQSNLAANAISELIHLTSGQFLLVNTEASGGNAAAGLEYFGSGAGGEAHAISEAENTSGAAQSETLAIGGDGGGAGEFSVFGVGRGGDAWSSSTARSTTGSTTAEGEARGGMSGQSNFNAVRNRGGNATSTTLAQGNGANSTDLAVGGSGRSGGFPGFGNNGGDANSSSTALSEGAAQSYSTARGGYAGLGGLGHGTSGAATSLAQATGSSFALANALSTTGHENTVAGRAKAQAVAAADIADASAVAESTGNGAVSSVRAVAAGRLQGTDHQLAAEAVATVGNELESDFSMRSNTLTSVGIGLPADAAVTALLADSTQVASDFDVGGTSDVLGYINMSTGQILSDNSDTFSGLGLEIYFDIDTSQLSSQQSLLVGLLDAQAFGSGFETLSFQIAIESTTVVDMVFEDVLAASEYFSDNTLDLGLWVDLVSGDGMLDVDFFLNANIPMTDMGFGFTAVFGNSSVGANPVPLPAAFWLLLSAVGLLFNKGRDARRV